ncbi:MAG: metal-dependent hydrolase [Rubrivivax sp.]|nr:metal-dependent hydrolase [Rubrivivax sp.]
MTTELPVRRLLVDLKTPFPRHWCGADAFRTALFNALSMSFPVGEQFFIDSVRQGLERLPAARRADFEAEVRGFIGQEATHRHVHAQFNTHLAQQGLINHWEPRARQRLKRLDGIDARAWLGLTAATEHFTAVLAEYLLENDAPLAGCEPRLRELWLWHSSEESEHRSTAFDLYRALGGNERWRKRLFWIVTWHFSTDLARQTLNNLWHDGSWWRLSTWASAWRHTLGRDGFVRRTFGSWRAYLRADFHPSQGRTEPGRRWLADHPQVAVPLRPGLEG